MSQIGEADIKFMRWAKRLSYCPMAVEATDGDFVPIALMGPEQQMAILRFELGGGGKSYEWVNVGLVREVMLAQLVPYK